MSYTNVLTLTLFCAGIPFAGGCTDNPADAKPAATVQSAPSKGSATSSRSKDHTVLKLGGDIIFVGSKVTGNHACKFTNWAGEAKMAAGSNGFDLTRSEISFVVQTKDLVADFAAPSPWSKKLETHLRSDDFFSSEKHPTARFQSSAIVPLAGQGGTHSITGSLTIKNITKTITFPATLKTSAKAVEASAEFSINRQDFNIKYAGAPDDLIRDEVLLKLNFKG